MKRVGKISLLFGFLHFPNFFAGSLPDTETLRSRDPFSRTKMLASPSHADKGTGVDPARMVPFKMLMALSLPFLPLLVYAVYHLSHAWWLLGYTGLVLLYFLVLGGWIAAEISICPPWYTQSSPREGLTMHNLPDYWQGIVTDPRSDYGYEYEDVEFLNNDGMTLRGWYVFLLLFSSHLSQVRPLLGPQRRSRRGLLSRWWS